MIWAGLRDAQNARAHFGIVFESVTVSKCYIPLRDLPVTSLFASRERLATIDTVACYWLQVPSRSKNRPFEPYA